MAARKNDLANRLLVYISIFIFSYEFLNYVNSLVVFPLASGSNMVELLALALIPCTAILAGFSFLRWVPTIEKHDDISDAIDLAGISLSAFALWITAQFSLPQYVLASGVYRLENVPYTLFQLGWFGPVLFTFSPPE